MNYIIKDDVLNAVASYLAARPYNEVFGLIKALQEGAKPHEEQAHQETICSNDQERQEP